MSVDSVVKVIEEDSLFYCRSGGGMTVSGGEPSAQADFVNELTNQCRTRGIDTAIETTGQAHWEDLEKTCRHADIVFYDVKHMDSGKHKAFTGAGNELILENLRGLSRYFPGTSIVVRTPVIPGFNDTTQDIEAISDFLGGLDNIDDHVLLPYHSFGEGKYTQLARCYSMSELRPPTKERMMILTRVAQKTKRSGDSHS